MNILSTTILPPPLADFWAVVAESKRIINAHSRHFLALSVLFLLPLSFSLAAFPTVFHTVSSSSDSDHNHVRTLLRLSTTYPSFFPYHDHNHRLFLLYRLHLLLSTKALSFSILYAAFVLLLFICAAGSLTYSVYHGFYGRPVKLSPAIRSLSKSYIRLLATFVVSLAAALAAVGAFAVFEFLLLKALFLTDLSFSLYFLAISSIAALILLFALTNLAANWILIGPPVVIESRWGIDCLVRSKSLVRAMRWTAIPLILYFGVAAALLLCVVAFSSSYIGTISAGDGWGRWAFVVQIVVTSALFTLLLLYGLAASTMLYMYCKVVKGELADEIAKEFEDEYVSLSFGGGDDKVPHLVSVVA